MNEKQINAQMAVMVRMQDELNKQVFADWRHRNLAWHRAIYIEAGEYLDHLGTWKWWKKGSPDLAQARMELIDIWHFGISWYMDHLRLDTQEEVSGVLSRQFSYFMAHAEADLSRLEITPDVHHEFVDALVKNAGGGEFSISAFTSLMVCCGLSFEDLYRGYVGKNMLNRFRQNNGYKAGTYVKVWADKEDNVHLDEILQSLPLDEQLPHAVYSALRQRYTDLTKA